MHFTADALALYFVGLVAETERKHIGADENALDVEIPAVETARPAPVFRVQVDPVILAVDCYVVEHRRWTVPSTQRFAAADIFPF